MLYCDTVCEGGVQDRTVPFAPLSASFQSLPLLPTSKLGPSGADSWVGGLVYNLGPCGSSNKLSCGAGSFSHCQLNSPQVYSEVRLYFPMLEPWVAQSVSLPSCSSQFICMQMWDRLVRQLQHCRESSPPNCLSPPLLPVWVNVSASTPWLSDFHTVQFSVSSGCFLFLNLLLSFFWLYEKAQCVYLCLHLEQKSSFFFS